MTETIPNWASEEISVELPSVREAGESTAVDFKEAFPEQAHRLGKEIAAMASSGGGRIYIGVNDNGDLCGLNVTSGDERDDVAERAHSIARNVKPTPNIALHFAVESGHTVLVIDVSKQNEPVFYYDYRPYVRDGRRARPAEPNEVLGLVWAHPSSEHQRTIERIQEQQMQDFAESSRERNRRHAENIDRINRSNFR